MPAKAWDAARILASPTAESAHMNRSEQVHSHPLRRLSLWVGATLVAGASTPALAVNYPVTDEMRSTANQVA